MGLTDGSRLSGTLTDGTALQSSLTGGASLNASLVNAQSLSASLTGGQSLTGLLERIIPPVLLGLVVAGFGGAAAFGALTVAPVAPQTLTTTGCVGNGAFGTPTIADDQLTLTTAALVGTAGFGSITIAEDQLTLTTAALVGSAGFGSITIAEDQLALTTTALAGSAGFGSPTVAAPPQSLTTTALIGTAGFGSPTISDDQLTLTTTALAGSAGFGSVTIAGATQTLSINAVVGSAGFGSPTIVAASPQSLTTTALIGTAGFGSVTIADDQLTLTTTALAGSGAFGSVTMAEATPQSLTTTALAGNAAFGSITIADALDIDVAGWLSRVTANGSAVNASEQTAMETMVASLKSGGYWDDITHMYCFVGDDHLAAKTYVKGTGDVTDAGSNLLLATGNYSRDHGFHRDGGSAYESVFDTNYTHAWDTGVSLTAFQWGRNSGQGARLGLHPSRTGAGTHWTYHESSFGYGYQIKVKRLNNSTQETGWGGSGLDTFSAFAMSYDGDQAHKGRSLNGTGGTGGASMTLSTAQKAQSGTLYYTCDNPRLGLIIMDNVNYSNADMDAVNAIIKQFAEDCGVTMGASDPDL
jgi:hypothetical protein